MKTVSRFFALLLLATMLSGQTYDTSARSELTDCASGGSLAGTLTAGETYVMRVTEADTFVCFASSASTCAAGGEKFPAGWGQRLTINGNQVSWSCRSSTSTGDVIFTKFK